MLTYTLADSIRLLQRNPLRRKKFHQQRALKQKARWETHRLAEQRHNAYMAITDAAHCRASFTRSNVLTRMFRDEFAALVVNELLRRAVDRGAIKPIGTHEWAVIDEDCLVVALHSAT